MVKATEARRAYRLMALSLDSLRVNQIRIFRKKKITGYLVLYLIFRLNLRQRLLRGIFSMLDCEFFTIGKIVHFFAFLKANSFELPQKVLGYQIFLYVVADIFHTATHQSIVVNIHR